MELKQGWMLVNFENQPELQEAFEVILDKLAISGQSNTFGEDVELGKNNFATATKDAYELKETFRDLTRDKNPDYVPTIRFARLLLTAQMPRVKSKALDDLIDCICIANELRKKIKCAKLAPFPVEIYELAAKCRQHHFGECLEENE